MNTQQESTFPSFRLTGADTTLFFALVYLYVWRMVDPRLVLHSLGILSDYYPFSFHTGWTFFREHLARPGGLVEYAARFLSQGYAFGWVGAMIVAAACVLGCWGVDAVGRRAGLPRGGVLRYVPAVLLLILYSGYSQPIAAVLALMAALGGFLLYIRWAPRGFSKRLATLVVGCAVVYQAAGSAASLFALMAAIDEFWIARRPALASAALACGLAAPWALGTFPTVEFKQAYAGFLLSDPGTLPARQLVTPALGLFFPVLLASLILGRGLASGRTALSRLPRRSGKAVLRRARHGVARPESSTGVGMVRRLTSHGLRTSLPATAIAKTAMVFLVSGTAAWLSLDTFTRTVLEIDYFSQREQWADVLRAADKLPPGTYNVRCNRNIALALYHTGRLGDDLFRYRQRRGADLFSTPPEQRDLGAYYQESRLMFELGQVNQAEKLACEALETRGDLPAVLEELAWINVVKRRPETARIFLNALALHPLGRRAAGEILERLDVDPEMDGDPRVAALRRNMVARDYVAMETTIEDLLQSLLETNPRNRMAFEFLMAHHLVVGRLDKAVACLERWKDFFWAEVPRHYQEAAAIHAQAAGSRPVVAGRPVDPSVVARAQRFAAILARSRSREAAAADAADAGFGDSYFFYFTFGTSGL